MCYWDGKSNLRGELLFYLSHKFKNSYCSEKIQERIDSAFSAEQWALLCRTTEHPSLEMPLKDHLVLPFLGRGASMKSLSMLSSLVLKICTCWGLCQIPGKIVSVIDCSHYRSCLFYTEINPLPVLLAPNALYFLHVPPGEESTSILCCHLEIIKYRNAVMKSLWRRDLTSTVICRRALSFSPVLL